MKTFITLLCLLCTPLAWAESLAWMPNNAGGKIILTDDACEIKALQGTNTRKIVSFSKEGKLITGCWAFFKYDENQIIVYWRDATDTQNYWIKDFNSYQSTGTSM